MAVQRKGLAFAQGQQAGDMIHIGIGKDDCRQSGSTVWSAFLRLKLASFANLLA